LSNTGTALICIGLPVFDRHHHHRYPVWGYLGAMNVLVWILDKIFDERAESRREPLCRF
jgi:nitrogenase molybdenum-iron protein beta chain